MLDIHYMQIEEAGEKLHIEWRYHEFRRVGMRGGSDYCDWKKKKKTLKFCELTLNHVEVGIMMQCIENF